MERESEDRRIKMYCFIDYILKIIQIFWKGIDN